MELNREQIIKAVKCQVGTDENHDCRGCYFYREGGLCVENMSEGIATVTLALFRELTEDNEQKDETIAGLIGTIRDAYGFAVRKMQERLKAQKFTHKNFGELVYVEDIDEIAKEMLEDNT